MGPEVDHGTTDIQARARVDTAGADERESICEKLNEKGTPVSLWVERKLALAVLIAAAACSEGLPSQRAAPRDGDEITLRCEGTVLTPSYSGPPRSEAVSVIVRFVPSASAETRIGEPQRAQLVQDLRGTGLLGAAVLRCFNRCDVVFSDDMISFRESPDNSGSHAYKISRVTGDYSVTLDLPPIAGSGSGVQLTETGRCVQVSDNQTF